MVSILQNCKEALKTKEKKVNEYIRLHMKNKY
jgi:hypothetical protein